MIKIDCLKIRKEMLQEAKQKVHTIKAKNGEVPCLAVIQVGDNQASTTYVNNKIKTCEEVGIKSEVFKLPNSSSFSDVKKVIKSCNKSDDCHAILLQLPLPDHLKKHERELVNMIYSKKDVDGLTDINIGKLWSGEDGIVPCTPQAILKCLENIDLEGVDICIINRSLLVGKPLMALLERANATVTMCHSKTDGITTNILNNDIIITAIGKPKYWDCRLFEDSIVIDVSINRDENGKLCGDVNWDDCPDDFECIYTSVPKGIGTLVTSQLMLNTIKCYDLQN